MTFASKFQLSAQRVVQKFAKELGTSTFKSLESSDYNTDTGVVTDTFTTPLESVYIAFDMMTDKFVKVTETSAEETGIPSDSRVAFIAGLDLVAVPKKDDRIIAADNGLTYRIEDIQSDMYSALYECLCYLEPV